MTHRQWWRCYMCLCLSVSLTTLTSITWRRLILHSSLVRRWWNSTSKIYFTHLSSSNLSLILTQSLQLFAWLLLTGFPLKWQKLISGPFQDFRHYKSQKITTYSSVVYSLLTRLWQQKAMDIKLPLTVRDAKTLFCFSTLHILHHKKLLHWWLGFSGPHSEISRLIRYFFPHLIKRWISWLLCCSLRYIVPW